MLKIRAVCLVFSFTFTTLLMAQEKQGLTFTLDHVALAVQDVERSAAFYGGVLGLSELVNRSEVEGIRWFSLGDEKELHLISVVIDPVPVNKAVHLALTTPDFDSFVTNLEKSEIEFSNWPGDPGEISVRADGTRQLYFQDLDGYWIEVNSVAAD